MRAILYALIALVCTATGAMAVMMSGSTTVLPLGVALSEAYTPGGIDVSGGGTGAGMQALASGTTDIAMASRTISADEKSQIPNYVETKIGYDGLCFITGGDVGIKDITQAQLQGIYNGSIDNWKQIGGIDKQIVAIGREEGAGTRDTFLQDVMKDKKATCEGEQIRGQSSAEVLQAVKGTPGAIGYVGFSYTKNVNVLSYNGVMSTEATIKDKTYPLARELYLYAKSDASQAVKDFVAFAIGADGQKVVSDNGFIPL